MNEDVALNPRRSHSMNILILMTDQQRFDTIAAGGYSHMKTPHLDELVRSGCNFPNAYTPAPICVAARHCLLTGMAPRDHGFAHNMGVYENFILNNNLPTYPRIFSENGYFTAAVGKMHFRPVREHHGFSHLSLMEEIPGKRFDDAYATYLKACGLEQISSLHGVRPLAYHLPQRSPMAEREHENFWIADRTKALIDANLDRPFLITSSWIQPHPPIHLPAPWDTLYDDVELPDSIPPGRFAPYPEHDGRFADEVPTRLMDKLKRFYFGSISMIDAAIGEIVTHLEELGILDDTLILFTSDHGEMLGDHGMLQKTVPYESSTRIPFVIRFPKLFQPGSVDERFVDLMDVLPTLADAAEISHPFKETQSNYQLQGESLIGAASRRDRDEQWTEFGFDTQRWVALRDRRYKYIYFYSDGCEQFFDLRDDPGETRNLVGAEEFPPEEFADLRKRCIALERRRGLPGNVHRWGFNHRKHHDASTPGGQFHARFANLQFPAINQSGSDTDAAQAHIEELRAALPWPTDRLALTEDPYFATHAAEWLDCFVQACGGSPEKDATTREIGRSYLKTDFGLSL